MSETISRDWQTEIDQLRQKLTEAKRKIEYEQLCASELEQQLVATQAKVDLATSTAEKVIQLDYAGSVWMLDLPKIMQNLIEKLKEQ